MRTPSPEGEGNVGIPGNNDCRGKEVRGKGLAALRLGVQAAGSGINQHGQGGLLQNQPVTVRNNVPGLRRARPVLHNLHAARPYSRGVCSAPQPGTTRGAGKRGAHRAKVKASRGKTGEECRKEAMLRVE